MRLILTCMKSLVFYRVCVAEGRCVCYSKVAFINMKTEKEVLREYLAKKNLKFTTQREHILEAFLSAPKHLSVDEMYDVMKKKNGNNPVILIYTEPSTTH